LEVCGGAVVEGDDGCTEMEGFFEDARHGIGHGEVGGGAVGEDSFVPFGGFDYGVGWAEFEG
jgi:hypothetical protein